MNIEKINSFTLKNISYSHPGESLLFENLNWKWTDSSIIKLESNQGQGKSVLLQIMGGLLEPLSGEVLINDCNIYNMNFEDLLKFRLNIGMAFDLGGLLHNRTLFENLLLPLQYHKISRDKENIERITNYLECFKIDKFKNLRPSFVSGSVRKVTILIRSLLLKPDLLLLDDPFVGLNPDQKNVFVDFIGELRSQKNLSRIIYTDSTGYPMGLEYKIMTIQSKKMIDKNNLASREVA